jgi:hypothetical protein
LNGSMLKIIIKNFCVNLKIYLTFIRLTEITNCL